MRLFMRIWAWLTGWLIVLPGGVDKIQRAIDCLPKRGGIIVLRKGTYK